MPRQVSPSVSELAHISPLTKFNLNLLLSLGQCRFQGPRVRLHSLLPEALLSS